MHFEYLWFDHIKMFETEYGNAGMSVKQSVNHKKISLLQNPFFSGPISAWAWEVDQHNKIKLTTGMIFSLLLSVFWFLGPLNKSVFK